MTPTASRIFPVAGIVCAILVVVAAIAIAGANPLDVASDVVHRALFTRAGFLEALLRAIPLTVMGLGIALAFKARIFNIGMDGQLIAGSVAAMVVAPLLPDNAVGLVLFLAAGLAGGALWGGIAGEIKARFGGNEIIATIMLNYIAAQILSWLVRGPMQEAVRIIPRTDLIEASLRLPNLVAGTRVHAGILIALAAVVLVAIMMKHTRFGFKLAVVGASTPAAEYAGIRPGAVASVVMMLSGALAGLAGTIEVSGLYGRLQEGFAPGLGIAAIAVALVARLNPWMVPVSAFGFSLLYSGLGALARKGTVPFPLINIIEAAIIFIFLAASVLSLRRKGANADG